MLSHVLLKQSVRVEREREEGEERYNDFKIEAIRTRTGPETGPLYVEGFFPKSFPQLFYNRTNGFEFLVGITFKQVIR